MQLQSDLLLKFETCKISNYNASISILLREFLFIILYDIFLEIIN